MLDELDIRILRELFQSRMWEPFPSTVMTLRSIGEKLHINKDTVRKRLQSLQRRNVLEGWSALLNPNLLSMKVAHVWLDFPNEDLKEQAIKKITQIKNLRALTNYFGNWLSFVLPYENLRSVQEEFREILSYNKMISSTIRFPRSKNKTSLTQTDWEIYKSIRNSPQKPHAKISKELGLSTKTIKRSLKAMADEDALLLVPHFNPKAVEGVAIDLLLRYSSPGLRQQISDKVSRFADDCLLRIEQHEEPQTLFLLVANNVSRAYQVLEFVRKQECVVDTRLYLIQDVVRLEGLLQTAVQPLQGVLAS